jgi:ATP-dependent RNA helicase DHX57
MNLQFLYLDGNMISGTIPSEIANITGLLALYVEEGGEEGGRREGKGGERERRRKEGERREGGGRKEDGRRKEEGGRRKEEGGRRKEEGGRRREERKEGRYRDIFFVSRVPGIYRTTNWREQSLPKF